MGNRRMGLGRLEALLEAVDRDLNLVNSTLTNCTITTSAACTFTGGLTATGGAVGTGGINYKRKVYHSVAQTAAKTLTVSDSGTLIVLASTASQIQVFNLPTITATDIGTFFEFVVVVTGNSAAAGSYTINSGGHASDATAAPTAGFDDFVGALSVVDTALPAMPADDASNVAPAAGDGTIVLADDTSNATIGIGTRIRCTAVAASTIGGAGGNVWMIDGTILTGQATGFVTTNLFTAP